MKGLKKNKTCQDQFHAQRRYAGVLLKVEKVAARFVNWQ
jgi:hypothetical protein